MICWIAKRQKSEFIDGRLRQSERAKVAAHLEDCASCASDFEQIGWVRDSLQALPDATAPKPLDTEIRVQASRARQAIVLMRGSRLKQLWTSWMFRLDMLMRPLTIPAAGGLLSSLVLFGALGHMISSSARAVNYDVPVIYADHTYANLVPLELRDSVILTLSLDSNGRITDYAARDRSEWFVGDPSRLQYNNISIPDFPSVLVSPLPVNRDISIRFEPIFFRH
jgi:hypothetical protein